MPLKNLNTVWFFDFSSLKITVTQAVRDVNSKYEFRFKDKKIKPSSSCPLGHKQIICSKEGIIPPFQGQNQKWSGGTFGPKKGICIRAYIYAIVEVLTKFRCIFQPVYIHPPNQLLKHFTKATTPSVSNIVRFDYHRSWSHGSFHQLRICSRAKDFRSSQEHRQLTATPTQKLKVSLATSLEGINILVLALQQI